MKKLRSFFAACLLVSMCSFSFSYAYAESLIPMGESIGVEMDFSTYTAQHDVLLESGKWVKAGDQLISWNNQSMDSEKTFSKMQQDVQLRSSEIIIKRDKKNHSLILTKEESSGMSYMFSNKAKGIGTLTYINPATHQFGALGHPILIHNQVDVTKFIAGDIFETEIIRVQRSSPGIPGYKIAKNSLSPTKLGKILSNKPLGIFGTISEEQMKSNPTVETAEIQQVKEGNAIIRTTIAGKEVQEFTINITDVHPPSFSFEVDDQQLLKKTGGILQGMSGSPVLQDGLFIGAITHMVVEKPMKGTAIGIEEMIKEAS
ncbi:SpoIVB peptidase S55 domain-containing protein [Paenisporosarcina cavernae]|uniref:Stage IV sporulation protein B n=1 Tax=Paenisporosarcina cavernae TaxID=2320858 RepID=A0A385YRX5_9BACL|nr:SpoIVB peptidase S55 domain-containing protein [Paenisporosarcina cavernae]AYC29535.1 stage IV sporulation protein B [Paenisporosarcina cavernae]